MNMNGKPMTVFLATGGTGGHVIPAIAVAERLEAAGLNPVFITDGRGAGILRRVAAHLPRRRIMAGSPYGNNIVQRGAGIARLGIGFLQTCLAVATTRPEAVIGFGGYASVAPVLLCRMLGKPVMLHEQNAFFGRANAFLARMAHGIALSWKRTANIPAVAEGKTVFTGMPVRRAFAEIGAEDYAPPQGDTPFNLLVVGGSLGAKVFGDTVPEAIAALPEAMRRRLSVVHQARAEQIAAIRAGYETAGVRAEVMDFITDMPRRVRECHLVIGRAGASFLAELAAAGRPAILVPFPHAMDDHQRANAEAVEAAEGGWCIGEDTLTAPALAAKIASLLDNPLGPVAAANAMRRFGMAMHGAGAAAAIAAQLLELLHRDGNGGGGAQFATQGRAA